VGNPFQDKFLKAGLVKKKQVTQAKREQRIIDKQNRNSKPTKSLGKVELEQAAQKKRIKEINQQHNRERQQLELLAQVKELIEKNRLEKDDRGEAYNFVEENKIKRIYVSDEVADQLSSGKAAIVKFGSSYEVVPVKAALQIAKRDKDAVLVLND
jgi:uncharacterized protein YaiL (DUF2058 family)